MYCLRSWLRQDLNPNSFIPESTFSHCSEPPLCIKEITTQDNTWLHFFFLPLGIAENMLCKPNSHRSLIGKVLSPWFPFYRWQDWGLQRSCDRSQSPSSEEAQKLCQQQAGCKSRPCHFLVVWPRASYLNFLSLSFLIHKMMQSNSHFIGLLGRLN